MAPDILALDFDGVICDGLQEYWQTAWRAYAHCWNVDEAAETEGMGERFRYLRPVIETGWEMPVLVSALVQGLSDDAILADWPVLVKRLAAEAGKDPKDLVAQVDGERDRQIRTNLDNWLALHRFYPGVLDLLTRVQQSTTDLFIVSTKEGRFIRQLLAQGGVEIAPEQVIGKEIKQPKYQTLRDLKQRHGGNPSLWFVEDRLPALQLVEQQPDLREVQLFLVDWGYNIAQDRQAADADDRLTLLSLEPFTSWQFP